MGACILRQAKEGGGRLSSPHQGRWVTRSYPCALICHFVMAHGRAATLGDAVGTKIKQKRASDEGKSSVHCCLRVGGRWRETDKKRVKSAMALPCPFSLLCDITFSFRPLAVL